LTALLQAQKKHADSEVFFGKKNFTVSTSNKANRRDNAYEQLGFGLKMSYEDRSELRKECSKFVRFSYLVDFVFQQALGDIYDRSV
jgi:dynein heavy chain